MKKKKGTNGLNVKKKKEKKRTPNELKGEGKKNKKGGANTLYDAEAPM